MVGVTDDTPNPLTDLLSDASIRCEPGGENEVPIYVPVDDLSLEGQQLHIYDCERMLGRGAMGVVYLARNTALDRRCALKVLSPQKTSLDVDYIECFEIEARAAAALVHPNVVTTHAIGVFDDHHYLEMEYVAGGTLQHEIDDHKSLGPLRATQLAAGIANGLAAAHRLKIVHRDLKPDNILVTPSGSPKIGDFGLAKRVQSIETGPVRLAGTPNFMSPEILNGASATTSSDVYALGVCYYLMLTGQLPFEGDSLQALMNTVISGSYPPVRDVMATVPLDMAEIAAMLLSQSPANRPADGAAARQLLHAVLGSAKDLDTLLHEAFESIPLASFHRRNRGFQVQLTLPGNRSQTVFLENSDHAAGERLLLIYSVCCPASPEFFEQALRLNAQVLHGGLSIRDIDDKPCFVMVDAYPRATVQGEEIRRSALEVGIQADRIERLLTGTDIN